MIRRTHSHFEKKEAIFEKPIQRIRFRRVSKEIKPNSIVCDLGCGYNANFLFSIKNKIQKGVGIDFSVNKKLTTKKIKLVEQNLERSVPKNIGEFNFIFSLAVLEHLENPNVLISSAYNLLKPGGKIVLTTPHKKSKGVLEFLAYRLNLISKTEISDHKHYYDQNSLMGLLKKHRFKNIKVSTFGLGLNIFAKAEK